MSLPGRETGVAKGLHTIEWLKSELLMGTGSLFKGLLRGSQDVILDSLAQVVISTYLLARRLGFGFVRLDLKIREQLRLNIEAGHEVEKWYGDLSAYLRHLGEPRKEERHGPSLAP